MSQNWARIEATGSYPRQGTYRRPGLREDVYMRSGPLMLTTCLLATLQAVATGYNQSAPSFRLGDWKPVRVLAGEVGHVRSFRATSTAPLSFTAESHNFDAIVRVETVDGVLLDEDDDSGIARNAHLVWSPPEVGLYHVRVLSKATYDGLAGLGVLCGALDPAPSFPQEAEEAYWRMVTYRALERGDGEAARVAAGHLDGSEDGVTAIVAGVRRERENTAQLIQLLTKADAARRSNDFERVRAILVEAYGGLGWKARTEVEASGFNDGAKLANAAKLLDLELKCNTAYIEHRERIRPPWYQDVILGRQNLAVTLSLLRKTERALRIDERTLSIAERTRPSNHSIVLTLQNNMAVKLTHLGDYAGARLLQESLLATRLRDGKPDGEPVLRERQNLVFTLDGMGDTEGALALLEQILAVREARNPKSQKVMELRLLRAKIRGDNVVADRLERELLPRYQELYPPGHPELLRLRGNIASGLQASGRLDEALASLNELLEVQLRVLPAGSTLNQAARLDLAWTYKRLGDFEMMNSSLLEFVQHAADALAVAHGLSAREAMALAASSPFEIRYVLGLRRFGPPDAELDAEVFRWMETRRLVSAPGFRPVASTEEDDGLVELRRRARAAQRRCSELLADPSEALVTDAEFTAVARERDRADRELGRALVAQTTLLAQVDAPAVAGALSEGAAAVSFLCYDGVACREGDYFRTSEFLAHVVRPDGRLFRVELGPSEAIAQAVRDWREAAGAPLDNATGGTETFRSCGARLRKLVLDPVLDVLEEESILHICLDDVLHLVSLDCLPMEGGLVGDRFDIRTEVSLARLLAPERAPSAATLLLAMGGIDFDARPSNDSAPPIPVIADARRFRAGPAPFAPLRGTLREVEAIAQRFGPKDLDLLALTGDSATKSRLFELAPRARILHLATHGYFIDQAGPETTSKVDASLDGWSWRERADSLLPGALCGLAFAGANRGRDSLGRLPGILTAEELSSADLSQCELAVLSACETSAGLHKPGQGTASLQAALHAAGARTAICSLWKVDDAMTRALMLDFYARLTDEDSPRSASDALWEARMKLRRERIAPVHWAGWVLTGEPD